MAENNNEFNIIAKIGVDASELDASLQNTKKNLDDLGNTSLDKSVKNFKQQLKEANNEAQRMRQIFGDNSKEFAEAAKKVAVIRDEIDAYNRTIVAFDPGNKLNAFVGIARSAAGAVQGVAGAMTFLGVESDTAAKTMAQLQGIMAFTDSINQIGDLTDFWKGFVLRLKEAKAAKQGVSKAQEGMTKTTKGLSTAMKTIPLVLLISLVAYLVSNWKELKESFTDMFPALKDTGKMFNDLKQVAVGVGNAILQFVVGPTKILLKLLQLDLKGAVDEVVNAVNVVKNYKDASNKQFLKQEDDKLKAIVERNIKANEKDLAIRQAHGEDTYKLEKKIFQQKLSLQKEGTAEYEEILQESRVAEAKHLKEVSDKQKQEADKASQKRKEQSEKAQQEKKEELQNIAEIEKEALAIIDAQNKSAMQLELSALKDKFNREFNLYKKNGKDTTQLVEAYNIQRASIEKKYADVINDYIKNYQDSRLDEYETKKNAIDKEIDELLKNATDEQRIQLEKLRTEKKAFLDAEKGSDSNVFESERVVRNTEINNVITDEDSVESATAKAKEIYDAKVALEAAQFADKLLKAQGNATAIEQLEKTHKDNLYALEVEHDNKVDGLKASKLEKEKQYNQQVAEAEEELQRLKFQAVQTGLGLIEQLAGKNKTIADIAFGLSKAAAIAEIVVNTQKEISGYAGNLAWTALPDGGAVLKAKAITAAKIRAGISIATVAATSIGRYMNKGGGGGSISAPTGDTSMQMQAPQLNVNQLNEQKIQDVRVTNTQDQVVKAYITERELESYEQKKDFKEKMKI